MGAPDEYRDRDPVAAENAAGAAAPPSLEVWMRRYQQADPAAPGELIGALSPALLRFFRLNAATREYAEDLLQETWLRIHRMRHSYRTGEPLLPWIYAIARNVRVDSYRRTRRLAEHEITVECLPEAAATSGESAGPAEFDLLVAVLPDAQREVITMLKATGMTVEEVARATSSTVGAVKLKAHRAYEKLREILETRRRQ
jgi:RNA polymerase sigma-70 factor (ECF subfamily)